MWPIVQHLIACDDVQADPNNLQRINVFGLITNIRSTTAPPFPVVRPLLCVLALMTRCQGSGEFVLRIQHNATGRAVYRSPPRRVRFVGSPQDTLGLVFRVRDCTFREAGLYWVELFYSGSILARRSLRVYS